MGRDPSLEQPTSSDEHNPYAPPRAVLSPSPAEPEQLERERIRREHLGHETRIRGLGGLWVLGGGAFSAIILLNLVVLLTIAIRQDHYFGFWETIVYYGIFLAGGLAFFGTGIDLRRLRPRARITGSFVSIFSMLLIPVGTILGIYGLYLLHARKGRKVLSQEYLQIRAATPEIRYRSGKVAIFVFVLLLGLAGLLFWYLWSQL